MVKHMIIWKMNEEITDKAARAAEIKEALESYLMGFVSLSLR